MPLSDTAIRSAKPAETPFKISDGGGLHLLVQPNGARLWRLAYRFAGRQKTLALGSYPTVSLAKARDGRESAKKQLADGIDPSVKKRRDRLAARVSANTTLKGVALEWLNNKRQALNPDYADEILRRLEADIFPALGSRAIADIDAQELLQVLRCVEKRGALEQARKLRQTVGQIVRYAILTGRASNDFTTALKGALKPKGRERHHTVMSREELPTFLRALDTYNGDPRTPMALRLIVLTMTRTTELRAARWPEVENLGGFEPLWRIPAARMKMKTEHLVPLSQQAVAALQELRAMPGASNSPYLFPSPAREGFMSENTMLYGLYRLGFHSRATTHGFRGLASTILNEVGFSSDWIERQLAHDERDQVRGAYNSAQYLPGRRSMLQWWADCLEQVKATGRVASLTREAAE